MDTANASNISMMHYVIIHCTLDTSKAIHSHLVHCAIITCCFLNDKDLLSETLKWCFRQWQRPSRIAFSQSLPFRVILCGLTCHLPSRPQMHIQIHQFYSCVTTTLWAEHTISISKNGNILRTWQLRTLPARIAQITTPSQPENCRDSLYVSLQLNGGLQSWNYAMKSTSNALCVIFSLGPFRMVLSNLFTD